MALFRRKPRDEASSAPQASAAVTEDGGGDGVDETAEPTGPFDSSAVPSKDGYVDLGAIWLPGIQGLMLTMEVDDSTGEITAVRVHLGDSLLQLQAFAAPRSSGIWDEIRDEIAATLPTQGGSCEVVEGHFGAELLARVPSRGPDGRTSTAAMRFVGIDGPRWFLRGVISGPAALDPDSGRSFADLLRITAVYRDGAPRGPRELLPLQFPPEVEAAAPGDEGSGETGPTAPAAAGSTVDEQQDAPVRSTDDLHPFERGPEITEIR